MSISSRALNFYWRLYSCFILVFKCFDRLLVTCALKELLGESSVDIASYVEFLHKVRNLRIRGSRAYVGSSNIVANSLPLSLQLCKNLLALWVSRFSFYITNKVYFIVALFLSFFLLNYFLLIVYFLGIKIICHFH